MTPAETEHFAALRMHVARLHAALSLASEFLSTEVLTPDEQDMADSVRAALLISEPDVRELLAGADRDNALVQCRAQLERRIAAFGQLEHDLAFAEQQLAIIMAAARRAVDAFTPAKEAVNVQELSDAMDALAEVLPK
jgi:hypothetical protein